MDSELFRLEIENDFDFYAHRIVIASSVWIAKNFVSPYITNIYVNPTPAGLTTAHEPGITEILAFIGVRFFNPG
jgi:hypothetical protein